MKRNNRSKEVKNRSGPPGEEVGIGENRSGLPGKIGQNRSELAKTGSKFGQNWAKCSSECHNSKGRRLEIAVIF